MSADGPGPASDGAPDNASGGARGRAAGRLLRWYPRAWRERYGEEFLAMVEDTLDGRRAGWRLRLGVAWSGLRERGHQVVLSGLPWKRNLSGWGDFVMVGCLLGVSVDAAGRRPPAAGAWQAATAITALTALAAVTVAAIVAAGAIAWPPFVRFLRAGGWPVIRRRIIWAAVCTPDPGGRDAAGRGRLCWRPDNGAGRDRLVRGRPLLGVLARERAGPAGRQLLRRPQDAAAGPAPGPAAACRGRSGAMSVASGDPGPGPAPSGRPLDGLLRWYPRAWRERYGEEFLGWPFWRVGWPRSRP